MQENKIARVHKISQSQICTKPNLHEGTKLREDDFAPRVNFARVTILHESKKLREKKTEKNKIKQNKKVTY